MSRLSEFAAVAVKSGLVALDALKRAHRELLQPLPDDDEQAARLFAQHLVQLGWLTSYQARKLLTGSTSGLFLGRYKVLKPLAKGGSSRVYLAADPEGKRVALKVLASPSAGALDPGPAAADIAQALARFRRELEVSRRLCHPRIAQVFELGRQDQTHYLAVEYIEGSDAESAITVRGPKPWTPKASAKFLVQVLDGLAALHASGVIHRDIKPSNLMVKPNHDAAILDLGSARILDEPKPASAAAPVSGGLVGTVDFISPEQIDHPEAVDARGDLYSLGCTLFFLLTGRAPFEGGGVINKIFKHRMEPPPSIPGLDPNFDAILKRLLAKDPNARPASCGELQTALNLWLRRERQSRSDPSSAPP